MLITNARARLNLPAAKPGDDAVINILIRAASAGIERHCRRRFPATAHDELYDGHGEDRLLLRYFPVLSVEAVRHRPTTVLTILNNSAVCQQARVAVTVTGLQLVRVTSGVKLTSVVSFAGNVTLAALATAVNALGNGWSAKVHGNHDDWPSGDLYSPRGALSAFDRPAELKLHTEELNDFHIDVERGWLRRQSWPLGRMNFRVQYTAGFLTVPEDVQEACAELVATWFAQRGRDLSLAAEHTVGTYSYQAEGADRLPDRIRGLLRPYRHYAI